MKHCARAAAAVSIVTLGLFACDHSATAPRLDQLTLDVVSGDGQTAIVSTQLAPLIVKVTSGGNPVTGQVLNFHVVSGGGSVYGGTELTDGHGIAQELWTLGTTTTEQQKVEVRAVESSTGAKKVFATFTATALPGAAAQITIGAGNQQTAHPLSSVPIAPAVNVRDQYGNPVPNVTVTFTPAGSSGSVTSGTPTTLANGTATVGSWTLGSTCGSTNTLTAMATGNGIAGNPATFTASAGDCWTTAASMPAARFAAGSSVVNDVLYVVGGNGTATYTYNPAQDAWAIKAPIPTARALMGVTAVNGILYAVAGHFSNGTGLPPAVEAYDPATDTWVTRKSIPTPRADLAAAAINGVLYAVGGSDGVFYATVEAYDPGTDTWGTKASMPTARAGLGVAAVNGILYAVGGYNQTGNLATLEAYDPVTDSWTTKTSMPTARGQLSVAVVNGILYAVGGNSGSCNLGTVEAYDPAADKWTTEASLPTARSELVVGAIRGIVYAVGGCNSSGQSLTTNEAYHP